MSKNNAQPRRSKEFEPSISARYVAPGDRAIVLLEGFTGIVGASNVSPHTNQFSRCVRKALKIVRLVGTILDSEFWQRTVVVWPHKRVMPKARSIRERRATLRMHEGRLQSDIVSLDDVRKGMDYSREQSAIMLKELALGLMVREITIPSKKRLRCAWTLIALDDGFRRMWLPARRKLIAESRATQKHRT
jgi:hypothetical protein